MSIWSKRTLTRWSLRARSPRLALSLLLRLFFRRFRSWRHHLACQSMQRSASGCFDFPASFILTRQEIQTPHGRGAPSTQVSPFCRSTLDCERCRVMVIVMSFIPVALASFWINTPSDSSCRHDSSSIAPSRLMAMVSAARAEISLNPQLLLLYFARLYSCCLIHLHLHLNETNNRKTCCFCG